MRLPKLRKIRLDRLFIQGIIYRIHIVIIQSIFWYVLLGYTTGVWKWEWAISSSLLWNICNTILYYNFHYWIARFWKLGK